MSNPGQARAEIGGLPEALVEGVDRAGRAANRVLVRWLLGTELSLLSACVLVALDPPEEPVGAREVANTIGISVEDVTHALHELRSLGYAREESGATSRRRRGGGCTTPSTGGHPLDVAARGQGMNTISAVFSRGPKPAVACLRVHDYGRPQPSCFAAAGR
jgi:hypothetical protein